MIEYTIVYCDTVDILIVLVNQKIVDMWTPLGGPFLSKAGFYMQAMTRELNR